MITQTMTMTSGKRGRALTSINSSVEPSTTSLAIIYHILVCVCFRAKENKCFWDRDGARHVPTGSTVFQEPIF